MAQVRARHGSQAMKDILLSSMCHTSSEDIVTSWTWVDLKDRRCTAQQQASEQATNHIVDGHSWVRSSLQDEAKQDGTYPMVDAMLRLLYSVDCKSGAAVPIHRVFPLLPTLVSLVDSGDLPDINKEERTRLDLENSLKLTQIADRSLSEMLEDGINKKLENGLDVLTDEALAMLLQQKELGDYKHTAAPPRPHLKGGSRILCLDGGGMKGLAQIEVLSQLEEATGRRITQLFDWIVGTSTGAIIALAMVYGELVS